MPEPQGAELLERLAAALAGMTGVRPWGGQYPSDPVVLHHYEAPRPMDTFLRLRVLEASGSTTQIKHINAVNNLEHDFRVKIEATVTSNLELPHPQGWVQRVRDDLLTTVCANFSLGGLCSGFVDLIAWESSESDTEFGQQVTLTMTVTYRFRESKEIA